MAVNAAAIKAVQTIILTNVFERMLKPQGNDEDSDGGDEFAAFTGAGGSIAANQVGLNMAKIAVGKFP
ncbi:MAG: hypothetical protein LH480_10115 [Rubrivivax sp.]|nr:hypothetical protein [Rubrivivax sp.]